MFKYEGQGEGVFWSRTIRRLVLIFLIGYLLSWFPFYNFETGEFKPLSQTRILGVLGRIALCYFFASIIIHYCSKNLVVVISGLLLVGYWIILYAFGDANDPYSLAGFFGNDVDKALLGESHLYHGEGVAFDPEGILSTIPAIVNVTFGYLAGDFIRRQGNNFETIAKLMLYGAGAVLLALTWHMAFPINKKIWTSSFTLVTVGIDLMFIGALIYVIEIQKKLKWTNFFVVFGRNPLFIYILADVLITLFYLIPVGEKSFGAWLYEDFFGSVLSPINASLAFALTFMLINWSIGYVMDKKKIYVRV
jgi:predicted acyltransferase